VLTIIILDQNNLCVQKPLVSKTGEQDFFKLFHSLEESYK